MDREVIARALVDALILRQELAAHDISPGFGEKLVAAAMPAFVIWVPKAMTGWTAEDIQRAGQLMPFLKAARTGLARSRWRPGDDSDDLLAPVTLAVLVEVGRRCELNAAYFTVDPHAAQ
jgi:hypothetical protein